MVLTTQQKATLKTFVDTTPALNSLHLAGNVAGLVAEMSKDADPAFTVWRTAVTKDEIYANGFDWPQVDNVTEPRWRIWTELFYGGDCNPSKPNVRAGISEVWTGTTAKVAVRDYVLGKCKRNASVFEKLFAAGTGSVAVPATLGTDADGEYIEGSPSYSTFEGLW